MSNEPLHDDIILHIIKLYEQGFDAVDIYESMDCRVPYDDVLAVVQHYDDGKLDPDLDEFDDFDDDYAFGSAGWGTDEFYE